MVDQLTTSQSCRICGSLLEDEMSGDDGLCSACATAADSVTERDVSNPGPIPILDDPSIQPELGPDPDNPRWGPIAGIGVWFLSVLAIIVIPVVAVIVWYFVQL